MKLGRLHSFQLSGQRFLLHFENGTACADVLNSRTVRFYEGTPVHSFAVEADVHEPTEVRVEMDGGPVLCTEDLRIRVSADFAVSVCAADGTLLACTSDAPRTPREKMSPRWIKKMSALYGAMMAGAENGADDPLAAEGHESAARAFGMKEPAVSMQWKLFGDEKFYGLGDKTGFLNKFGYEYENWNTDEPKAHTEQYHALYKSIPFLIVLRNAGCFGFFFDSPHRSRLDLGKENTSYFRYEADGGAADWYFLYGPRMTDVVSSYTALTGRQPLPQLWTLGYHQSRWGYDSAESVREIASRMRAEEIPCDAIHFDIDYMDGYRVFTWDEEAFGAPGAVVKELGEQGFHAVPIIDPGVKKDPGYAVYDEGVENGYFAKTPAGEVYVNTVWPGEAVFPDFGREEVRRWWAGKEKYLTDLGFAGTWNDMNEPASFRGELPPDVVFHDEEEPMPHAKMHNVYGHLMSKATWEGLKDADGKRPFVITRACYAGTQKYATVWTGDNMSLWMHLQMMIPQLCNLGLSGFSLCGTDIGGFGGDTTPELLTRWIEAAVFSPLFRNHSCSGTNRQEPWLYGEETLAIYRKYVRLRYELLPYIYDLCRVCEETGLPVMRPLVLHYEDDPKAWNCSDEFLVGESLLAAPVVEQGARQRIVYFPAGTWYDYRTGKKYEGNTRCIVDAPLDALPLFAKEGSIIPTWEVTAYVGEKEPEILTLRVYPGEGTYVHYRDNGEDFAYRGGAYDAYRFEMKDGKLSAQLLHRGFGHPYAEVRAERIG